MEGKDAVRGVLPRIHLQIRRIAEPRRGFAILTAKGKRTTSLVLLGIALFVVSLGFGMFTPILPQYAVELGIDTTSLGLAYSLYNVALIIFLIPSGIMADRLGRVKTIVIGMAVFSISSLMLVFAKDLLQFAAARAVEGIGAAVVTPAVFALIADLAPSEKRGSGMGYTSTMDTVGSLAGPTIGGSIAQTMGLTFPFYAAFLMALLSGALLLPIRDPKAQSRSSSSGSSLLSIFNSLRQNVSENRSLLVLCFRGFIVGITQGLFVLVFVLYMAFQIAMQPAEVGFSFTLVSGATLAFAFLAGNLSDRFGRKPFVILGGIVIASGVVVFSFTHTAFQVYMVSLVLGFGIGLNNAPINALLADYVIPEIRARVMGGYEVILGLGRALGVAFLGALYAISALAPFYLLGGLMLLTVGLVALFAEEPRTRASIPPP
jgi:MFS family permease